MTPKPPTPPSRANSKPTKKDDIKKELLENINQHWNNPDVPFGDVVLKEIAKEIFDDIEKWRDDFLSNLNLGPTEFPYQQITEGLNELKKKWLE